MDALRQVVNGCKSLQSGVRVLISRAHETASPDPDLIEEVGRLKTRLEASEANAKALAENIQQFLGQNDTIALELKSSERGLRQAQQERDAYGSALEDLKNALKVHKSALIHALDYPASTLDEAVEHARIQRDRLDEVISIIDAWEVDTGHRRPSGVHLEAVNQGRALFRWRSLAASALKTDLEGDLSPKQDKAMFRLFKEHLFSSHRHNRLAEEWMIFVEKQRRRLAQATGYDGKNLKETVTAAIERLGSDDPGGASSTFVHPEGGWRVTSS